MDTKVTTIQGRTVRWHQNNGGSASDESPVPEMLPNSPAVPVTGPFGGMVPLELAGAPDEESLGP